MIVNRMLNRFIFTDFPQEGHAIFQKYQELATVLAEDETNLKAMRALLISRNFMVERFFMRQTNGTNTNT